MCLHALKFVVRCDQKYILFCDYCVKMGSSSRSERKRKKKFQGNRYTKKSKSDEVVENVPVNENNVEPTEEVISASHSNLSSVNSVRFRYK